MTDKTKNHLVLIVSIFIFLLSAACLYIDSLCSSGIPVLNYHQINDRDQNALTVSTEQFAAQMAYLDKHDYHTVTPQELVSYLKQGTEPPENPVVITFDDGYKDNYKNAYPILKQHNMTAIVFLISDYVSTYPNYLTWNEIDEMKENNILFGSHTLNHVDLSQEYSYEAALYQLKASKAAIEWHLHKPVDFLAYPCGSYNDNVIAATQSAGYQAAFTVNYGLDIKNDNLMALNRIPIFGGNTHTLFRFKMRLLLAPVIAKMERTKTQLRKANHPYLANLIITP